MLTEKERWEIQVLHRGGDSIRHIRAITGHDRKTIRDVLAALSPGATPDVGNPGGPPAKPRQSGRRSTLEPFKEFLLGRSKQTVCTAELLLELRSRGFRGSLRSLQRFLHASKARIITTTQQLKDWMHLVLQGAKTSSQIRQDIADTLTGDEVTTLLECVRTQPLRLRNRALALLAHGKGITPGHVASFLCVTRPTVRHYISDYKKGGVQWVLDLSRKEVKKADDPNYAASVFKTIHAPPSAFGFNRTTWRMDDLYAVLLKQGVRISRANIRRIIRVAGYKFRKAKKVLTSTDPEYREKLQKITQILANLKPDEKFFSIDEFGPFAVKIKGGRALAKPGEMRSVPVRQKSKGSLIATAALELSTNQITHFYSEKKNTDEMIRMLELLVRQYRGQTRIFFSWDAASWHGSKKFFRRVDEINEGAFRAQNGTPVVELAPLPSCAQFLNVIESVFSGMARAIIHNSDYASVEAAKAAIDRYFAERNDHFLKHPRRAGKKLWGKERIEPEFNEANNCKDPRW
jgi:transposase